MSKSAAKVLKLLIVGEPFVGKTSLLTRYCEGNFTEQTSSTIGTDYKSKQFQTSDNRSIKLAIWVLLFVSLELWQSDGDFVCQDTAGQEKFRNITSSFYRGAHGTLLVFDVTDIKSFNKIEGAFNNSGIFHILTTITQSGILTSKNGLEPIRQSLSLEIRPTTLQREQYPEQKLRHWHQT
jgi:small GTP-binding protein